MVDNRGTLTADEAAVVAMLRKGPALLGPRTEEYEAHRPPPRLWAGRPVGDGRAAEHLRYVDTKVARRLAKAGLVALDGAGGATLPAGSGGTTERTGSSHAD